MVQHGAQIGSFGELGILRAATSQVLQNAEKQYTNAHLRRLEFSVYQTVPPAQPFRRC
jgi:hypothetical protein